MTDSPPALDSARWVSATALRNWMLDDPLLDWLDRFGPDRGFRRDNQLPAYDPRTDFTRFLFARAAQFEAAVLKCFTDIADVAEIDVERSSAPGFPTAEATLEAMRVGAEVIYHGLVIDPSTETFGEPDLLVRSDVLHRLFPEMIGGEEAEVGAPAFQHGRHYRVIDIKFTTLRLSSSGLLLNEGSAPAYRAQVYVYTRALGAMQGYLPASGYTLGRSWEQRSRAEILRGAGCMERLGPVEQGDERLARRVDEASAWIRRVRAEGGEWNVFPRPTEPELWPNLGHSQDHPWHHAKREIAEKLEDLTLLWGVGRKGRADAHAAGVFSWRDPRCTPAMVGVTGAGRTSVLGALLEVNRAVGSPPVLPAHVQAAEDDWRPVPALEFYVDFETVSDLSDDFSALPARSGQAMIFMIGCGHVEAGAWAFRSFVADELTETAEGAIIDAWFAYMHEVRARLAPRAAEPWVMHWSQAEESTLETAYNSAVRRHPERTWRRPHWFDFLGRVMRAEPVVVRGALNFGLKSVAQALRVEGLIATSWPDGLADGLSAAVGAWRCEEEAHIGGELLSQMPLMQEIAAYNEVDCKVMMEIVRCLREKH